MVSPITKARVGLWDAILNWPALRVDGKPIWARMDRFEGRQPPDRQTIEAGLGPGDLPALAIISQDIGLTFEVTRTQAWRLRIMASIWTPEWDLLAAERLAPEFVNAAYAGTPNGVTVTFVETATGFIPDQVPGIRFTFTGVGPDAKTKATRTDITFQLRFNFSPFEV